MIKGSIVERNKWNSFWNPETVYDCVLLKVEIVTQFVNAGIFGFCIKKWFIPKFLGGLHFLEKTCQMWFLWHLKEQEMRFCKVNHFFLEAIIQR